MQKISQEASYEARDHERYVVKSKEDSIVKELEEKYGMVFTTPEIEPFQKAVDVLYKEYPEQDILNEILSALGR